VLFWLGVCTFSISYSYSSGHYKVNVPLSFYDRNTELYVLNKRKPFVKTEAEIVNRYTWCERLDAH